MFEQIKERIFKELGLQERESGTYYGEWALIEGKDVIESYSPINGKLLGKVTKATEEEYETVVVNALAAYKEWTQIPAPKRGLIIKEVGKELEKYKEILGLLVTLEGGKTISEGQGEIQEAIDIADFAVGLSRQLYGVTIASEREDHRMYEQWLPLGVIGEITSFNFPVAVWSWNAFIAAVVGNVIIWKPSSKTPLCAVATSHIINTVLSRYNLKPIFYVVSGDGSFLGDKISQDPRIPLVSFTGSTVTGKKTGEHVARRFGKSILELGGNNAAIVSQHTVDMKMALKGVAFGAMATAGQRCTSTRRLILQEDIYDHFLEKLKGIYDNISVGNPLDPKILVGPLIDETAVQAYERAIQKAKEEGGKLISGGERVYPTDCEKGTYVRPTIIEAHKDMSIVQEETFAPILYVIKYKDLEDAIDIHNAVPQGLSSAIFSNNLQEVTYFLSQKGSDCGIANVNTGTAGAEIGGAFGGEKETGGGRESGSDAWKGYARRQTVTINYGNDVPLSQGVEFTI